MPGPIQRSPSLPAPEEEKTTAFSRSEGMAGFFKADVESLAAFLEENRPEPLRSTLDPETKPSIEHFELGLQPGEKIRADTLRDIIKTTAGSPDGREATGGYAEIRAFIERNRDRLTEDARRVYDLYREAIYDARDAGQNGLSDDRMRKLFSDMEFIVREERRPSHNERVSPQTLQTTGKDGTTSIL